MENLKLTPASDPEILRLLRAFFKIRDPRQRREIVTRVEWLASDQTWASETSLFRGNKLPRTEQIDRGSDLSFLGSVSV
jgi:hypothetical protein